jgi:ribulose-phosphate 3-epimerase
MPVPARPLVVASVLPCDFAALGSQVQQLERAGVDRIQWDVMDGRFVPNLTFGPDVIAATRDRVAIGYEAHLMVERPDPMLDRWIAAGCDLVIVHAEATTHLHRTLGRIRELGARSGVALNPATPLTAVEHVLDLSDLLLVMTVNPGFGGQRYLSSMRPKIEQARRLLDERAPHVELEVDGGIGPATIADAAAAGARVFCAGSALFTGEGTMADRVGALRAGAAEAIAAATGVPA